MTLRDKAPLIGFHRERSYYSDNTDSSHINPTGIMGTDTATMAGNASRNKMTKKLSHPNRHHDNHRPRSKSCDRHRRRHSPTHVHKKKCATKRNLASHSKSHHLHKHGRLSPKLSSSLSPRQQLCGKLWVRPVAVPRRSTLSRPVSTSDNYDFAPTPYDDLLVRRVTDSSVYDEEMMWATLPNDFSSSSSSFQRSHSSFGSFQRRGITRPKKNARIVFGESGKLIQPRNDF